MCPEENVTLVSEHTNPSGRAGVSRAKRKAPAKPDALSKRFAPFCAAVNASRASVWSARSLLPLFRGRAERGGVVLDKPLRGDPARMLRLVLYVFSAKGATIFQPGATPQERVLFTIVER